MTPSELGLRPYYYYRDPNDITIMHGIYSIVKVKQSYIDKMKELYNLKINNYYMFRCINREDGLYKFHRCDFEEHKIDYYTEYELNLNRYELNDFVEEYVAGEQYKVDPPKFKFERKDSEVPGLMGAWIVLFIIMAASTIVGNGFQVLWAIELFVFNIYRKSLRNDDNND